MWVVANKYPKVFSCDTFHLQKPCSLTPKNDVRREKVKNTAEHLKVETKEEMEHIVDFFIRNKTGLRSVSRTRQILVM